MFIPMNIWIVGKDSMKQSYLQIELFYSNLNWRDINKDDYRHAQRVWSLFNIKNLGEYYDLYVQSDTAQLTDIFEQFGTLCLKEYELDPGYFCTTPGLAMEACLK